MRAGCIVFNGVPSELSTEKIREIYGTAEDSEELKLALAEGPMRSGSEKNVLDATTPG
jgi:hypothetical protein